MLTALSIRDIVLIDRLHVEFGDGLTVLTGETGAGKSIILDALGLALGARGDGSLVRQGVKEGTVIAQFQVTPRSPPAVLLEQLDIDISDGLILRRVQAADGRTRAFINDQPVSVQILRRTGAALVEIHGQHDDRALLDRDAHRAVLDAFGGLERDAEAVARDWANAQAAHEALEAHRTALEKVREEEEYLRFSVEELEVLAAEPGEEERLAQMRRMMMHAEKFTADLTEALEALSGDGIAEARMNAAVRKLERNRDQAAGRFDAAIAALDRAMVELAEARSVLGQALLDIQHDPGELERTEERLFALKAAARKYRVGVDDLPGVAANMADQLAAMESDMAETELLEGRLIEARDVYTARAERLREDRLAAAVRLDTQVMQELGPLKLEKAVFATDLSRHGEGGPYGFDVAEFTIAANPGQAPGALMKIASGGELARFILGLKVVLAEKGSAPVLVFDEIDTGAGGAVADAIGARLAALSRGLQVLAVTHSPQVAAQADAHLRIVKRADGKGVNARALTEVETLDDQGRKEEVARMLAGAEITQEARAAAARLIGGRG